jgi:23S rRNA (cytosine1962-C5)-methyltransferase
MGIQYDPNTQRGLMKDIIENIEQNSQDLTSEFKRLFHGRGGLYPKYNFLTIDSIDTILSVAFYFECEQTLEDEILLILRKFIQTSRHDTIILQKRYIKGSAPMVIEGKLNDENYAIENGIKFILNLKSNQNSGYFPDMKLGREFIKSISKDKKVLNLFSYTCGFSLAAISGGAVGVVNMDMSKSALSTGRQNHRINNLDTSKVKFYPHNILKSFSRIKKDGPYDIIIIDPPTFQKGSFAATNDYVKIIKRLDNISTDDCVVLACLNSPDLDSGFIIDLFDQHTSTFKFDRRLDNLKEFKAKTEEKSLKNLVFSKK